ncbi:MAG: MFS transporter [Dehalococcoidia bacterium]|nr:MFS transporter [Dehalococcoidia bacterium]
MSKRDKWTLPVASVITFLGFVDTHLLIPIIALYASGLGASIGLVGLIVGLYSIVNTPANIVFGRFIDRVGYKRPLVVGLSGNVLSMLLYAFARSPLHLAMVRALHGLSGALVAPATMSIVADHAVSDRRGRAMSFYGMALACASLVGYPVSGVVASRLGVSAVFFLGASLVGLAIVLSMVLPGGDPAGRGPDSGGSLRKARSLLTSRRLVPAYAAIFAQYFTFGSVVTLLPVHVERLGMEAFEVGILLATFSALFVLTQLPGGAISDRLGRRPPVFCGLSCVAISLVVLPSLSSFALLAGGMALYGVGYGLLFPSVSAMVADHTAVGERGLAVGLFHALLTAGVAVGAPVMGLVAGLVGTPAALMLTAVPVLSAFVIAVAFLREPS